MYRYILALAVFMGQAEAAGLRGAARRAALDQLAELEDDVELAQVSLVQKEATMHQASHASTAAGAFQHAIQGVVDAFSSRIDDVSGEVGTGKAAKLNDEYEAFDTREASANLALLQEIESLKAQNLDVEEKLALLDEDRAELEKGLVELTKNVSMAKEFAVSAKSGLFGAPQPQLQLGSFDGLDQDENAFEEKHRPHPGHAEQLAASARPDANDHELADAVLRSVEASLKAESPGTNARHASLVAAHAGLLDQRSALERRRAELEKRITAKQVDVQPLADRVLEATYNGVSLNMGVVGMSAPECEEDPASPGCRSRAWTR